MCFIETGDIQTRKWRSSVPGYCRTSLTTTGNTEEQPSSTSSKKWLLLAAPSHKTITERENDGTSPPGVQVE